jgi:SAM-dependent methyltransferase
MSDDVRDVHRYWESLARLDPLWAVLSDPTRKGRKWDLASFLETGRREISTLFYLLEDLKIPVDTRRALDFGCGVGRVTQALGERFDAVVGVDISETMVRLAGRLNRHGGRVRYVLNQGGDLRVFPDADFSFVYTNIVLQHLPPPAAWDYLAEFWRVLAPGGLLIFQLPSHLKEGFDPAVVVRAMPEEAYRAEIRPLDPPAAPVAVSAPVVLEVVVRNISGHDWRPPVQAPIRLGNHWLDAAGTTMLIQDDGRTFLPEALAAGGSCRLTLDMTAPAREGDYAVELDLVHESISWFKDKGSVTVRFPVRVRTGLAAAPPKPSAAGPAECPPPASDPALEAAFYDGLPEGSEDPGAIPMYGLPSAEVLDFLDRRGAEVLYLERDESCGREWIGYRYFVRKPGAGEAAG